MHHHQQQRHQAGFQAILKSKIQSFRPSSSASQSQSQQRRPASAQRARPKARWDDSITDLNKYKLSAEEMLARKSKVQSNNIHAAREELLNKQQDKVGSVTRSPSPRRPRTASPNAGSAFGTPSPLGHRLPKKSSPILVEQTTTSQTSQNQRLRQAPQLMTSPQGFLQKIVAPLTAAQADTTGELRQPFMFFNPNVSNVEDDDDSVQIENKNLSKYFADWQQEPAAAAETDTSEVVETLAEEQAAALTNFNVVVTENHRSLQSQLNEALARIAELETAAAAQAASARQQQQQGTSPELLLDFVRAMQLQQDRTQQVEKSLADAQQENYALRQQLEAYRAETDGVIRSLQKQLGDVMTVVMNSRKQQQMSISSGEFEEEDEASDDEEETAPRKSVPAPTPAASRTIYSHHQQQPSPKQPSPSSFRPAAPSRLYSREQSSPQQGLGAGTGSSFVVSSPSLAGPNIRTTAHHQQGSSMSIKGHLQQQQQ